MFLHLPTVNGPESGWALSRVQEAINTLSHLQVLPTYSAGGYKLVLESDLADLSSVIFEMSSHTQPRSSDRLFQVEPVSNIPLPGGSLLIFDSRHNSPSAAFGPAVRNLVRISEGLGELSGETCQVSVPFIQPMTLCSNSLKLSDFAKVQVKRISSVDHMRVGLLANSAPYMGSKKELAGFLIESFSGVVDGDDTLVVDLMCGSGAASAAFSRYWETVASDAQVFCRLLARIQGAGLSVERARSVRDQVVPVARAHAARLIERIAPFIDREDEIFHGTEMSSGIARYRALMNEFPTMGGTATREGWSPEAEVKERRENPLVEPYCLFTTYFANVYFGIRQSVEIDSLRFAISQLASDDQDWALGALVATVSSVATTYGGHFAQPAYALPESIDATSFPGILEKRAHTVIHEFAARLVSLAAESETGRHGVITVPGPWQRTLESVESLRLGRQVIVYVDPPYRRDEYSRYYHVLETLVSYSYPSISGKGLLPAKASGDRFMSEFFTRSPSKLLGEHVNLIVSILTRGWTCAWSYADNADCSIPEVVEAVRSITMCSVHSYSAKHRHRSHGGRKPKRVIEYLVVFRPRGL